jgi:hypothetical protein
MTRYYRVKKDKNHDELSKAFEQMGCTVVDLIRTGVAGLPDVCVGSVGVNHLVEYKSLESAYGRSGLNSNQMAFDRDWRGEKVWIVDTVDGVVALVTYWRKLKNSKILDQE